MQKVTVIGIIGHGHMKPKLTWQNNDGRKTAFIRFSMFCVDEIKRTTVTENGVERQKTIWQVILPDTENSLRLFEKLAPHRMIMVEGNYSDNPRIRTNKRTGQNEIFVNRTIKNPKIRFLDSQTEILSGRMLNLMRSAGLIDAEQKEKFLAGIKDHLKMLSEKNPPRIEEGNSN